MGKFLRSVFAPVMWFLLLHSLRTKADDGCGDSANNSCILPNPKPTLEPGNLDDLWLEASCMLSCVEKYDRSSTILEKDTVWPTMNYTRHEVECTTFQKIRECKEGCVMRHSYPYISINRCRDLCYSACETSPPPCILGDNCELSFCGRSCRMTYCRFGCEAYDETKFSIRDDAPTKFPPAPSLAPVVSHEMPSPLWKSWLHYTDFGAAALEASSRNSSALNKSYSTTAYLVKLSTSSQNFYIWQKDTTKPLDLSPFACTTVSISFAVVSKFRTQSASEINFSPSTSVCSSGVGDYPSNVTDIQVSYSEDTRESYIGYSVAKVSWTQPNDSQYLTSYTLRVYPDKLECGGTDRVIYTYNNIDRKMTRFTLQADSNNGLWRFGCSYIVEVVSLPSRKPIGQTIGAYVSSAAELSSTFPPLVLKCDRVWNDDGNFNISVEWEFPASLSLSHITRYILTPSLQSSRNGIIQFYNSTFINSNRSSYVVLTQMFVAQDTPNMTVVVDVSVEKNHMYYWRTIPRARYCSVPATPLPPSPVAGISTAAMNYNETSGRLSSTIVVSPPVEPRGSLEDYELVVLTSRETCKDCDIRHGLHFWSKTSEFNVSTSLDISNNTNCLYVMARASNHYNLSGHWVEKIFALNNACDTSPDCAMGPVLSIVYQREDGSSSRVLDLSCPVPPSGKPGIVQGEKGMSRSRLQAIDFKLQDFTLRIEEDSEGSHVKLLSQSMINLASIEKKINSVLEMLAESGR